MPVIVIEERNGVEIETTPVKVIKVGYDAASLAGTYLKKDGDTGRGNFTFEQDVEVGRRLTERGGSVLNVYRTNREIWVSKTGSDDNTGDEDSPYLDPQKAIDEAARQISTDQTIIYMEGVEEWEGQYVVPFFALGKIHIVGSDTSDPTKTKFKGRLGEVLVTTGITINTPNCYLTVEGVEFDSHWFAVQCLDAQVDFIGCKWVDCSYACRDNGKSKVRILAGDYVSRYDANPLYSTFAFLSGIGGSLTVSDNMVLNGMDRCFSISEKGVFTLSSGFDCYVTHKENPAFGPFTIYGSGDCRISISGRFFADGGINPPKAGGSFIYSNDGSPMSIVILGGRIQTLSNFDYRISSSSFGYISFSENNSAFSETNVNNTVKVNIGSYALDLNSSLANEDAYIDSNGFDTRTMISDYNRSVKTINTNIARNDRRVLFNTTTGDLIANLPSGASLGETHEINKIAGGNKITVNGNDHNIYGVPSYEINSIGPVTFMLVEVSAGVKEWIIIN